MRRRIFIEHARGKIPSLVLLELTRLWGCCQSIAMHAVNGEVGRMFRSADFGTFMKKHLGTILYVQRSSASSGAEGSCCDDFTHFVVRMDGVFVSYADGQDAEDVDDKGECIILLELKYAHVPVLEKMVKRKLGPVLAMQAPLGLERIDGSFRFELHMVSLPSLAFSSQFWLKDFCLWICFLSFLLSDLHFGTLQLRNSLHRKLLQPHELLSWTQTSAS